MLIRKFLIFILAFLSSCTNVPIKARAPVIVSIEGTTLSENERTLLKKYKPFAVLLFQPNCKGENQVKSLTKEIKDLGIYVAIDIEGKLINRFKDFHPLDKDPVDFDPKTSLVDVYNYYLDIAKYAKGLGIDIIFGPVTDICTDKQKDFLYKRCFRGDVKRVSECSLEVVKAYQDAGIFPVIKHLPGHGKAVDSHKQLPTVDASFDELLACDIAVSKAVVEKLRGEGRPLTGGMVSHVVYNDIDPDNPATFSKTIIQDVVKGKIGLEDGIIFSDAMSMGAVIDFLKQKTNENDLKSVALNKFLEAGGNIAIFDYPISELDKTPELFSTKVALNLDKYMK